MYVVVGLYKPMLADIHAMRSSAGFDTMMGRTLIRVAVLACIASYAAAVLESTNPNSTISISYTQANGNSPTGSADLPLNVLGRKVPGAAPDQIKVIAWGNNSYLITWATGDGQVGPAVLPPPADMIKSMVMISTDPNMTNASMTMNATGIQVTYMYDYSLDVSNGTSGEPESGRLYYPVSYASPVLHHVLVEGLMPNTTYYYKVGDPRFFYGMSEMKMFKTAPGYDAQGKPMFPFRLGVFADLGQSTNSSVTAQRMAMAEMDAVALIGDFCYADTYRSDGCQDYNWLGGSDCPLAPGEASPGSETYQPRWDTWSRLWEPIFSGFPVTFSNGNHEIEELPTGERFKALNARFPGPPAAGLYDSLFTNFTNQMYLNTIVKSQVMDLEYDLMGNVHNMYYAIEMGPATLISLSSMIGGDTFAPTSPQYVWFEKVMQNINRTRTPWVIAYLHFPIYTSYAGTWKTMDCFRQAYEPLFFKYGVDIMFNGHVHSYERSNPVVNYTVNECGTVHIVVGDGGNVEGMSKDFADTTANTTDYCQPGQYMKNSFPQYQPQACFTMNPDGQYCDFKQPAWSAYRNPSFGFGVLTILNETTAYWLWNNTDNGSNVTDEVYLTRNLKCSNAN